MNFDPIDPHKGIDLTHLSAQEMAQGKEKLLHHMAGVRPMPLERSTEYTPMKDPLASEDAHLSPAEHREGYVKLRSFIAANPPREVFSFSTLFSFGVRALRAPMVLALLFVTVSAGSIAYAAESSIPGDTLYSLKVEVTEPVIGAFYRDENAKALWEMRRLQRRLKEAYRLVVQKETSPEHWETLEKVMDNQEKQTQQFLTNLEKNGNTEVATTLRMHLSTVVQQDFVAQVDVDTEVKKTDKSSAKTRFLSRMKQAKPTIVAETLIAPESSGNAGSATSSSLSLSTMMKASDSLSKATIEAVHLETLIQSASSKDASHTSSSASSSTSSCTGTGTLALPCPAKTSSTQSSTAASSASSIRIDTEIHTEVKPTLDLPVRP